MGAFLCFYLVSLFKIPFFFAASVLIPGVFAAYETDVIKHSWSIEETMREEARASCCFEAHPLFSNPKCTKYTKYTLIYIHTESTHIQCIMAHLICGNGGSSDEGRDGGLCDHAVGGDAVRRGVEPEPKGKRNREINLSN